MADNVNDGLMLVTECWKMAIPNNEQANSLEMVDSPIAMLIYQRVKLVDDGNF